MQPLVLPISLNPGTITTPEITTDIDHDYDIVLDFQGLSVQIKKDRCLIGGDSDTPGSCEGFPSLIDVSWKLFEGDKMISEGQSEKNPGALWSSTVERSIGKFEGHEGHRYKLILDIKKDASSLNTANPRLKIQVPPLLWEGYGASILIQKAEAGILAIIGVLILVGAFLLGGFKSRSGRSTTR